MKEDSPIDPMKQFAVNKAVLFSCFTLSVYYAIMELYYYYFVGVSYSRFHMDLNINTDKYVETKVIFILTLIFLIFISKKSEFIYSIFVFFLIFFSVPALVTYSFNDQGAAPLYCNIALLIAIGTISLFKVNVPEIKSVPVSNSVLASLVFLSLLPFLINFGTYFNINNLLLSDIDETRALYDENSSTLFNYLYNWLVKAVLPVMVVYFLIRKRYSYASATLFIMFYLYLVSGNKIVYITVFVVLFFYFFGEGYFRKVKVLLNGLILILLVLPLVDEYLIGSHILKGTFVMRMLFLPAELDYLYFDFFADKPVFFAESNFFKWFVTYPYYKPSGFIIAETYFSAFDMNANNGIISDGFMNLGYLGVAINIFIVAALFLFFNSINLDSRYLGVFFVMIFLFLSAPMLSMFITSGLWITIIMAMSIMRKRTSLQTAEL